MGQQDTYLSYINWSEDLSEAQRIDRGPLQPAFAVGKSEVARAAVMRAQQLSRVHHLVHAQVKEQAVFAVVAETEGLTIREIASRTGIPKSEVGRIVRRFTRDKNGSLQATTKAGPMMGGDLFKAAVRATWDEASSMGQRPSRNYGVKAYRDGKWWTFEIPELNGPGPLEGQRIVAMGQAGSRNELSQAAREVAALWLDVDEDAVTVNVTIVETTTDQSNRS